MTRTMKHLLIGCSIQAIAAGACALIAGRLGAPCYLIGAVAVLIQMIALDVVEKR